MFTKKDIPTQTTHQVRAVRSEYGRQQMLLTAPLVVNYTAPERKTVYPEGFVMQVYDGSRKQVAYISARYACTYDDKHITEARDSVVAIDYRTGDTTYLNSLVWNETDHLIYSKDPVRSVNGPRVTYGDGFESDDNFTTPQIIGQRGTLLFEE